jgi:hypothetical protein
MGQQNGISIDLVAIENAAARQVVFDGRGTYQICKYKCHHILSHKNPASIGLLI